jgi:hypothetical protein
MLMLVPEIVAAPSAPKLQLRMALAGLFVKPTVAVGVSTRLPSVTSVAVKTDEPLVTEVTVKVTKPLVVEVPEAAEIVSWVGRLEARVTVLPETGLLKASLNVTLIVVVATPSAATEAGEAVTIELVALTDVGVKVTVAVCATTMTSVPSVAVKMAEPVVVDFTVKVTTPEALEAPEAAEIVSVDPRLEASVTVLPGTGALVRVNRVTVTVDVETPLAVTEVGDAVIVEWVGSGAPAAKVTVAVCAITIPSLVSVAVNTAGPAVVDFTVKVTTPFVSEVPDAGEIVSVAPRLEASVTVLPAARLLPESFKVTVMVAVLTPSLATVMGMATTVELVALGIAGAATLTLSR